MANSWEYCELESEDLVHELVLMDMQIDDKRKIITDLVDKITVYEGGNIALEGHLPLFDQKLGCFHGDRDNWSC